MKVFSPFLKGDTTTSGSLNVPQHPTSSAIINPTTGSLYNDTTDNVLKVYTGTQWQVVGEQAIVEAVPSADIEYLLVAGGGGGGSYGGGGAGGYLSSSLSSIQSGSTFTITVGSGGAGSSDYNSPGVVGVDSSIAGDLITTITALGGGYGGDNTGTTTAEQAGDGGSGGGGSDGEGATPASPNKDGGSGTVGQGNNGGDGTFDGGSTIYVGGGGGGAGTDGADATLSSAGAGGNGLASSITGTSVTRAGGGGGVTYNSNASQASGGTGGGGNGGTWNATTATSTPLPNSSGGTVNTGGGGGATNAGGSGVAIFAYDSGSINAAGGIVGDAGNGRKYNQFNTSGTFKVGSTSDFGIVTSNLQLHLDAGNFASRGTSTWTDLSGNNNNGIVTGATLSSNFFYTFDGSNDYVTLPESAPANTSPHTVYGTFTGASETNWTLECWFKTSENDTDTWGTPIIGRDVNDLFAQLIVRNNYVQYMHADPSWQYVSSTSTVTDDNWHHVVLVNYSNATMDLWLDGTKEATGVDSTINYTDTRYFKLTHVARGYLGDYTACEVAQIRLYDTNLSDAQVIQNYNVTKTNFI